MSDSKEKSASAWPRQRIFKAIVLDLRRRTEKADEERATILLQGFKSQSDGASRENLLRLTASFLDKLDPEQALSRVIHTFDNDTSYVFKEMDKNFSSGIKILQEDHTLENIRYVFEVATDGISLMERIVQYTFLESLELLLGFGISLGPHRTPLTVFRSLENLEASRSYMRSRLNQHGKEIRSLLDRSTLCMGLARCDVFCTSFRVLHQDISITTKEFEPVTAIQRIGQWCKDRKAAIHELTWFHVSSTNGLVLEFMLRAINEQSATGFKQRFGAAAVAPGDPLLTYREVSYWTNTGETNKGVIVFPTLLLTTIQRHVNARKDYESYRATLTTTASGDHSPECIVHLERTLDEAYFPNLKRDDLMTRNAEQVVSRQYEKSEEHLKPLLVVPQLWLWRTGNFIVSAHGINLQSKRFRGYAPRGVGDFGSKIFSYEKVDTEIQTGLIIAEYIRSFGEEQVLEEGLKVPPTLDLFESQVVSILSAVKKYTKETKRDEIIFEKEESFHENLSDFRSELAMIQYILQQQETILDELMEDGQKNRAAKVASQQQANDGKDTPAVDNPQPEWPPLEWTPILQARDMLTRYQARVRKIDADAERIESNVQDLLNLKRTYVSIQDSHASVQDSHASVLLSVAAVGFAIITIIFAPLAFLTALFALKIQGFESLYMEAGGDGKAQQDPIYHGGKLAGVFIGTEVLTIVGTATLVWITFRLVGIDLDHISTMRAESDQRREDKKRGKSAKAAAAAAAVEAKARKELQKLRAKEEEMEGQLAELERQGIERRTKSRWSLEEKQASETSGGKKDTGKEPMDLEAQLPEPRAAELRISEHREM